MKVNEAPEKIYFTSNENGTHYYTEGIPFEREYVEYIRTDVFIEKAREWLRNYLCDYFDDTRETYDMCIDEFIKAMKV